MKVKLLKILTISCVSFVLINGMESSGVQAKVLSSSVNLLSADAQLDEGDDGWCYAEQELEDLVKEEKREKENRKKTQLTTRLRACFAPIPMEEQTAFLTLLAGKLGKKERNTQGFVLDGIVRQSPINIAENLQNMHPCLTPCVKEFTNESARVGAEGENKPLIRSETPDSCDGISPKDHADRLLMASVIQLLQTVSANSQEVFLTSLGARIDQVCKISGGKVLHHVLCASPVPVAFLPGAMLKESKAPVSMASTGDDENEAYQDSADEGDDEHDEEDPKEKYHDSFMEHLEKQLEQLQGFIERRISSARGALANIVQFLGPDGDHRVRRTARPGRVSTWGMFSVDSRKKND